MRNEVGGDTKRSEILHFSPNSVSQGIVPWLTYRLTSLRQMQQGGAVVWPCLVVTGPCSRASVAGRCRQRQHEHRSGGGDGASGGIGGDRGRPANHVAVAGRVAWPASIRSLRSSVVAGYRRDERDAACHGLLSRCKRHGLAAEHDGRDGRGGRCGRSRQVAGDGDGRSGRDGRSRQLAGDGDGGGGRSSGLGHETSVADAPATLPMVEAGSAGPTRHGRQICIAYANAQQNAQNAITRYVTPTYVTK